MLFCLKIKSVKISVNLSAIDSRSSTCPRSDGLSFVSPALDGGEMFLSGPRVQTSQDFIQALGLIDDLTGRGKDSSCQQYSTGLHVPTSVGAMGRQPELGRPTRDSSQHPCRSGHHRFTRIK